MSPLLLLGGAAGSAMSATTKILLLSGFLAVTACGALSLKSSWTRQGATEAELAILSQAAEHAQEQAEARLDRLDAARQLSAEAAVSAIAERDAARAQLDRIAARVEELRLSGPPAQGEPTHCPVDCVFPPGLLEAP